MYLFVHATAGAFIGKYIQWPSLAFLFSFISHFLLDIIPHGDKNLFSSLTFKEKFKKSLNIGIIDLSLTILILLLIFHLKQFASPLSVISGACGAVLPDFIWFIFLLDNKLKVLPSSLANLLGKYYHLHEKFHYFLTKKDLNYSLGLSLQVILSFFIIFLIIVL